MLTYDSGVSFVFKPSDVDAENPYLAKLILTRASSYETFLRPVSIELQKGITFGQNSDSALAAVKISFGTHV